MISKIFNLLAVVSIATLLALGGMAGFLFGSGRLTQPRIDKIAAVLRGELDADAAEPETAATTQTVDADGGVRRRRSADAIKFARDSDERRTAILERAEADVRAQRDLLNQALQNLVNSQESFDRDKEQWQKRREKLSSEQQDEGFRKELAYVKKLSAKQAKMHIIETWKKHPADAVRIFNALKPREGQRIFDEFKTPEEYRIMHELLEQLRNQDLSDPTSTAGRTSRGRRS